MTTDYVSSDSLRNSTLADMATLLQDQRARALDVVAPASAIGASAANLVISGTEPVLSDDGVDTGDGTYSLTASAEGQLASRLDIPVKYLRRMRTEGQPGLWDSNVNTWLRTTPDEDYLVRVLRTEGAPTAGIIRAVLSSKYRIIDNFDVLLATLAGIKATGVEVAVTGADLTEKHMYLRVACPEVKALAPELLKGYRSPFDHGAVRIIAGNASLSPDQAFAAAEREGQGYAPGTEPVVFAGFVVTNSDTGHGSFSITPRLEVQICKNGLTIAADGMRRVHLGSRLDAGIVDWSADTQQKNLDLVKAQTRDAVATFLSHDYLTSALTKIEQDAGVKVTDPAKTVTHVAKKLLFSDDQASAILEHFILGGQLTAGGIGQAVSSVAQTITNGDDAAKLEESAVPAMALAAAASR